jgi:hypothetical protein
MAFPLTIGRYDKARQCINKLFWEGCLAKHSKAARRRPYRLLPREFLLPLREFLLPLRELLLLLRELLLPLRELLLSLRELLLSPWELLLSPWELPLSPWELPLLRFSSFSRYRYPLSVNLRVLDPRRRPCLLLRPHWPLDFFLRLSIWYPSFRLIAREQQDDGRYQKTGESWSGRRNGS